MKQAPKAGKEVRAASYSVAAVGRACDILACFRDSSELLDLGEIAKRAGIHKVTAFRILSTLVAKNFVEKVGRRAYRRCLWPFRSRRFLIGCGTARKDAPFTRIATESIEAAARDAELDVLVLDNGISRALTLRNADVMVRRKVDLAIEFQRIDDIAPQIADKFSRAGIPLIVVGTPHPGAAYFGADNYKAGRMAGVHLGRWATQHWNSQVDETILLSPILMGAAMDSRMLGLYEGLISVFPRAMKSALYRLDSYESYEHTQDAVRQHLRRNKSRRILVGAANDMSALAALETFREFGREEACAIVSHTGIPDCRQELRRPKTRIVGSVAFFPELYGGKLIRLALDILENRPYPPAMYTQHRVLTPENVDKIYPNDLIMDRRALNWPAEAGG